MVSLSVTNANAFVAEYWKLCSLSPLPVLALRIVQPAAWLWKI